MRNKEIAEKFYELAELAELANENSFKVKAYLEAARVIENLTIPIEELAKEKKLTDIKGVGKGIAEKIEQYLDKGTIDRLEELKKEIPESLLELSRVPGLGAKRIKILYEKLGVKNIDDLRQAATEGKIRSLEGFGEKTEQKILSGISALHDKKTDRFSIGIALPIAESIVKSLKENTPVEKILVAGSLRRMKDTIGDIDILVTSDSPTKVMDYFASMEATKEVVVKGETKTSIITKENLQVDLRVVESDSFGAASQYFTGSKEHNVKIREIAIKQNFKLNEYGLFDLESNKTIAGSSETEIYEKLGLEWIPPEMREDRGEIEQAQSRSLPKLVELEDVKGDLHLHSTYSDGANTIKEMALKAKKMGYEYIVVSDHAQALGIANGLTMERFLKQREEIDRLNVELEPFRIFQGVELNILSNGELDFPDEDLKMFDICLAGIHTGMNQSADAITKRMLKAIENPYVRIIVHPTGRVIGSRNEYEINLDSVFEKAKEFNTIFEINSSFERLDLNDINSRNAKQNYGLRLS
ncbi:MAG: DNA polymerase/3'-5' exonuclease PolX, partial [Caldisericaceae bacterium]